ncbi:KRAB-A domain-containing protein 2-like [Montipora capricornis]|uniref:KRAB-A domain-containing protein 2-like n=1 Tax=Montipora capricornis TaxID=246305 RepID=UPI0035F10FB2
MDVFSRYLWLVALPTKSSRDIARELRKIYERDEPPDRLQSDQGLEFHGRVENIYKTYKIRRIQSRPYHPQSQGKVKRSHRRLRDKMMFHLLTTKGIGIDWAKTLPRYCKVLNEEKKEQLGWLSPFEVYYGRKSNVVTKASLENYDIDRTLYRRAGGDYVCLEVEESAAENISNDKQENQEVLNEDENETEKAEENNSKRQNKTNGGADKEDQRVKEGIYENPNDNNHQQRRSKETSSFDHLPNEIIAMIFETVIRSTNPNDACIISSD